jgi:hypothetical protein
MAPTTQAERTEGFAAYCALEAAAAEVEATAYEMKARAAMGEPNKSAEQKSVRAEWCSRQAADCRATADEWRQLIAGDSIRCGLCGDRARLSNDHPCPRCQPDLTQADAASLLAAMNHEIRAEVTP